MKPSIKQLREICQQSGIAPNWRTQSLEGRMNRIFSIYFTWILVRLPFTPNQVTVFGTVLHIGSIMLFIFNNFNFHILALFLIFLSFILDAADGELARYKRFLASDMAIESGSGVGGVYVEPVTHDIIYAFLFLPIGIGVYLLTESMYPLIAAFLATSSKLLFRLAELRFYGLRHYLADKKGIEFKRVQDAKTPTSMLYFLYRNFFTGTGIFTMLVISVLIKHLDWFLYFYAFFFVLLWIYKMMRLQKKIKIETRGMFR